MKNLKLISLLMVLPLVGCGPKTDPNPGPGPGPDPDPEKTVKRTELYASFIEIGKAVTGDEDFTFDPEYDTYYNEGGESYYASDILEGQKDTTYKWENAIADFMKEMPSKYVKVMDVCDYTWDDGDKGLQTAYTLGESIYVSVATWEYVGEDATDIYVSYAVMPNEGYTMVDDGEDIPVSVKEQVKTFTFKDAIWTNPETEKPGGLRLDYDSNIEPFIKWFNGTDDLLESVSCAQNTLAQFNNVSGSKTASYNFILGGGSTACDLTFGFKYPVVKIEMNVQAYCKYVEYTSSWNVDTNAKLYINGSTDVVDLSTTDTSKETTATNIVRSFDKKDSQKTLRLQTDSGQRVFLNSITITYLK